MGEIKKEIYITIFIIFLILLTSSIVSAGFFDRIRAIITGEATKSLVLNITLGAGSPPNITRVLNDTIAPITLSEGAPTNISINFTAYDPNGADNLNDATAEVNVSKSGEQTRYNNTCVESNSVGNYANYSCVVTFWWWDLDGPWTINVSISDNNGNSASNSTLNVTINSLTALVIGPSLLSWGTINPGSENQTPTDFLLINNTGNQNMGIGNITINSTSLMGETTTTEGLYSGNFTASNNSAGTSECGFSSASRMNITSGAAYNTVAGANLSRGNFTIGNGVGQEQLYFCLIRAGVEISQQSYSTSQKGSWTVQISNT